MHHHHTQPQKGFFTANLRTFIMHLFTLYVLGMLIFKVLGIQKWARHMILVLMKLLLQLEDTETKSCAGKHLKLLQEDSTAV